MKGKTSVYQIILVLNPKLEESEREGIVAKVEAWWTANGATIGKKEHTGAKELVYDVAGMRKGDFWELEAEAKKAVKLSDINVQLNRETGIIRYLILRK